MARCFLGQSRIIYYALKMDLDFLYKLAGLAAFIIAGAHFVVMSFFKMTFGTKKLADELRFTQIEAKAAKLEAEFRAESAQNNAFKHKYKTTLEGFIGAMDNRLEDLDKSMSSRFTDLFVGFTTFKELIETKIDLAISRNNEKK
jgi:hypothetical protein